MSNTFIILSIVIVILVSLLISAISYHRQQNIARKQKKLKMYNKQIEELSRFRNLLLQVDSGYELLCLVQQDIVTALKNSVELEKSDLSLTKQLEAQQQNLSMFQASKRTNEIKSCMTSDAELNGALFQLNQLLKALDLKKNGGQLSDSRHAELRSRIQYIKFNLEIETNLFKAEEYAHKRDVVMYQLHLKKARDILKKAPIDNDTKNKRIRELTEKINASKRSNSVFESNDSPTPTDG